MKQLIILITGLLLLISCENNITGSNDDVPEENNYYTLIKNNVFIGDSIVNEQGYVSDYNAIYKFTEDSISIETGINEYYSYNISNDTLFTSGTNNNFIILEINNDNLKMKSLRNNSLFYLTKYK